MELNDSQYLLVLAPSLVVVLIFIFFWIFTKETSYDEVLARQGRGLRSPSSKPDTRRKSDKKKGKKKEGGGAGGGGGAGDGGESDSEPRDVDLTDASAGPVRAEEEKAPAHVPAPAPAPVPVLAPADPPTALRERKKKEKKQQAAPVKAEELRPEISKVNGSKAAPCTSEPPVPVTKQPSPPPAQPASKKKVSQKKAKTESVPVVDELLLEAKVDQTVGTPVTVNAKLQNSTTASTVTTSKKKNLSKRQKAEPAPVDEPPNQAPLNIPVLENDSVAPINPQRGRSDGFSAKITSKEIQEKKLREILASLRSLALSKEDVVTTAALLREKNPSALDAWHRSVAKWEPSARQLQESARLQEEASIAQEKVRQLSQELQVEKQKTGRMEALLQEQRRATEKELNVLQAKAQGSYQELQTVQVKFQQVRDQLEGEISRLQQENSIFRDAVSTSNTQMESQQSSELNQLRSECAGLMKELSENRSKLQQEELQRKAVEVNCKQKVSQLEEAKRRWEEVQAFLHSVSTEREKLQAANQELQAQLLLLESQADGRNAELQALQNSLAHSVASKDQMEQKVVQLLEASQHSRPSDALQVQDLLAENKSLQVQIDKLQAQVSTQTTTMSHVKELQKLLAEKEVQRKSLEDSLNAERSSGVSWESDMQAIHTENVMLKADLQKLQARISEQTASQFALDQSTLEKDEKLKMVEKLLETGLIEMANKEEGLKALREENDSLRLEIGALQQQKAEQMSSESVVEELRAIVREKEEKMTSSEERLQRELENLSTKEKAIEAFEQQVAALKAEVEQARLQEPSETSSQLQELHALLSDKQEETQTLKSALQEGAREAAEREKRLQALEVESSKLKSQMEEKEVEMETVKQELLTVLAESDAQALELQSKVEELRDSLELHRRRNDESGKALESVEAECREVLHRLLPAVPLPCTRSHQEFLQEFEISAKEAEDLALTVLEDRLKQSEEAQQVLQKDCQAYKNVLAETEGILQRLQRSVEQEESCWKVKLEESQVELREMALKMAYLEGEVERLSSKGEELENLRREKLHLESERQRAEDESAAYERVVVELKDLLMELQNRLGGSYTEAAKQNEELNLLRAQLAETLSKRMPEDPGTPRAAADLHQAHKSLDLIQADSQSGSGQVDQRESSLVATQDGDRLDPPEV